MLAMAAAAPLGVHPASVPVSKPGFCRRLPLIVWVTGMTTGGRYEAWQEDVCFLDVVVFGRQAESVGGGLGDPGADRGAFAGGSLFDRFSEIVGE